MFVQEKPKEPLVSDKDVVAKQIKNRDRKPECRERGYYTKDDNGPLRQVWGLLRFDSMPPKKKISMHDIKNLYLGSAWNLVVFLDMSMWRKETVLDHKGLQHEV